MSLLRVDAYVDQLKSVNLQASRVNAMHYGRAADRCGVSRPRVSFSLVLTQAGNLKST